jgi:hypothetical protein
MPNIPVVAETRTDWKQKCDWHRRLRAHSGGRGGAPAQGFGRGTTSRPSDIMGYRRHSQRRNGFYHRREQYGFNRQKRRKPSSRWIRRRQKHVPGDFPPIFVAEVAGIPQMVKTTARNDLALPDTHTTAYRVIEGCRMTALIQSDDLRRMSEGGLDVCHRGFWEGRYNLRRDKQGGMEEEGRFSGGIQGMDIKT